MLLFQFWTAIRCHLQTSLWLSPLILLIFPVQIPLLALIDKGSYWAKLACEKNLSNQYVVSKMSMVTCHAANECLTNYNRVIRHFKALLVHPTSFIILELIWGWFLALCRLLSLWLYVYSRTNLGGSICFADIVNKLCFIIILCHYTWKTWS